MKVYSIPLGPLGTNCYIAADEKTKECLIIDPAANGEELVTLIRKEDFKPKAILLTHGHSDHIGAVEALQGAFDIPLYIHKLDLPYLTDVGLNLSEFTGNHVVVHAVDIHEVAGGDTVSCGSIILNVLETPGHTPGGVSYYGEGVVFVGDTLFYESVGRTDFVGGSMEQLVKSVTEQLLTLPDDTLVYPGHGPATTIGHERQYNGFLQ